jgi:hypothetical protein
MFFDKITGLGALILFQLTWVSAEAGPLTVPKSFSANTLAN